MTKAIAAAPGGIVRSGMTVTVTTVAPLADFGWTLDGTIYRTAIQGATPTEYNGDVWSTRTGANTFTYQIATTPGAYAGRRHLPGAGGERVDYAAILRMVSVTFDTCLWMGRFAYHFTSKCEFHNTLFYNPQGSEAKALYMLGAGVSKAVAAMEKIFVSQEPLEASGSSLLTRAGKSVAGSSGS